MCLQDASLVLFVIFLLSLQATSCWFFLVNHCYVMTNTKRKHSYEFWCKLAIHLSLLPLVPLGLSESSAADDTSPDP